MSRQVLFPDPLIYDLIFNENNFCHKKYKVLYSNKKSHVKYFDIIIISEKNDQI